MRRAISASYYGVFHCIAAAVADELVGKIKRKDPRYAMVYRSVDHDKIKNVCNAIQVPKADIASLLPGGAFGHALRQFCAAVVDLQSQRHTADYDPGPLLRTSHAKLAVLRARQALALFSQVGGDERQAFVTLLAFKHRK